MDNRVLIWRRPGEEWTPQCLNPGREARMMIWGCITYEGVSTLTVINGNINAAKYIEIVDNFVWPAQSLDLNIIENVWRKMKIELQKSRQLLY